MSLNEVSLRIPTEHMANVFGQFDANIKKIERTLGVTVVVRDDKLKIIGTPSAASGAQEVFEQLYELAKRGNVISEQNVNYALALLQEHKGSEMVEMDKDVICHTIQGKPVKPKTLGQKDYVDNIRKKMIVFGMGLYQIMGAESFQKNMEKGLIEVAPLAYMRGRTLDNAFIILDEAQNTTPAQMKMFLTRIGFGSKAVITGDATQKDLAPGSKSGLDVALRVLKNVEEIGICKLTSKDVVRHPLVQKIVQAYDAYEKKQKPERPARRRNGVNER